MIVVNVDKEHIRVSGHSGYAEIGKDIVCAGVSALLQSLVQSLEDLTEDVVWSEIEYGSSIVKFKDLSERGKLLVDSFFIGVCMVANTYPDYIRIK